MKNSAENTSETGANAAEQATEHTTKTAATYLDDINKVIAAEREYLKNRRNTVGIEGGLDEHRPWGVALSGGGIRSATFCLGVIQALTKAKIFRRFDYMSTVSGGGYIGSCLSSLIADDPEAGVEPDNSLFVGLRAGEPYQESGKGTPKNSVRYQLHHLRSKGNYLAGSRKIFTFEAQRFGGTAVFGALHNFVLFSLLYLALVAGLHAALSVFGGATPEKTLGQFGYRSDPNPNLDFDITNWESFKSAVSSFVTTAITDPVCNLWDAADRWKSNNSAWFWGTIIFGGVWTFGVIVWSKWYAEKTSDLRNCPPDSVESGLSLMETRQSAFIKRFNWLSLIFATALTFCYTLTLRLQGTDDTAGLIFLPLWFALGGAVSAFIGTAIWETSTKEVYRIRRSFYAAVKGGALLGVLIALAVPHVLVLMFAVSHISFLEFSSLILFLISAWLFGRQKSASTGFVSKFISRNYKLLLNTLMILTLLLAITPATHLLVPPLYQLMDALPPQAQPPLWLAIFAALGCLMCFFDANRLSPFNFYRDRLTEAYLQTFGRVLRRKPVSEPGCPKSDSDDKQGMGLKLLSSRETIKMQELNSEKPRGPYHLITASMNVSGTHELLRKDTKSEHFLFSPLFCGSRSTGYVATEHYHGGSLRLSRAMTVAGAAASSGMGIYSFAAQAFFITLFNLRLGQWMNNPWWQRPSEPHPLKRTKPTFWLIYLLREMFGRTNAGTRRVLLSDGGHTGDNLGLLPLLQRRCAVIVVVDADNDKHFTFDSFNDAVRMAFVEENIRIDIDLTPLECDAATMRSRSSVALGLVHYPPVTNGNCETTGLLVYLKSSVSELRQSDLAMWEDVVIKVRNCVPGVFQQQTGDDMHCCSGHDWHIPAHVENYNRKNVEFPHEGTGDQFYDPEQFEAYRALGEHIGRQAARALGYLAPAAGS